MINEVIVFVRVKEFVRDRVNDTNWFVTLDRVNELVINLTRVKKVCRLLAKFNACVMLLLKALNAFNIFVREKELVMVLNRL